MKTRWIGLITLLSWVIGSCGTSPAGTELTPELPRAEPEIISTKNPLQLEGTQESTEMLSISPVEKIVVLAKQDLASRLGVKPDKVTLVKSAEQLWLNAALGCPRPGVVYPSGRVPGFQIWLEAVGIEYVYNTDFNGTLILCPELNPDVPNATTKPPSHIGPPIK